MSYLPNLAKFVINWEWYKFWVCHQHQLNTQWTVQISSHCNIVHSRFSHHQLKAQLLCCITGILCSYQAGTLQQLEHLVSSYLCNLNVKSLFRLTRTLLHPTPTQWNFSLQSVWYMLPGNFQSAPPTASPFAVPPWSLMNTFYFRLPVFTVSGSAFITNHSLEFPSLLIFLPLWCHNIIHIGTGYSFVKLL